MASTIFSKLSPTETPIQDIPNPQMGQLNNLVNQIMGSINPQQAFSNLLATNKDAKNAMDLINQYGNGDPKTAFMNYMNSQGKQALGQQLMQRFGLK